jgi:hypothetical protein
MRKSQSTLAWHCARAAGVALIFLLGCAQSEPLTFISELDGAAAAEADLGSGGNQGATGGVPANGSGGSGTGGTGTGGSGTGGTGTGGFVGTGGNGTGGFAATGGTGGGTAGHSGTGGSAGKSGGATGGQGGSGGTAGHAGTGGTTGTGGSQAATFTEVYTMILDAPSSSPSNCAGSGCHVSASGAAGLHFDTEADAYQTLLNSGVAPGSTATSSLYTNISSGSMPRGRPKLSATLIALVASWINGGALNN